MSVDQITYFYCVLMAYLTVGLLAINTTICRTRKSLKKACKVIVYKLWSVFMLLFDQEYYISTLWSNRVLWVHYCLAYFLLVFGYFWSLLSTDMVVTIQPYQMHSVTDLFSRQFNNVQPVIFKNLAIYSLLRESKANTTLHHIYKRVQINVSASLLNMDASNQRNTKKITNTMITVFKGSDDLTLVTTKHLWSCAIKPAACMLKP